MSYSVDKTEDEWRKELGEEQYAVLRQAATERAWTGELLDEERAGLYTCGACNAELFKSGTKFDSGCGWPSFYESIRPDAVELIEIVDPLRPFRLVEELGTQPHARHRRAQIVPGGGDEAAVDPERAGHHREGGEKREVQRGEALRGQHREGGELGRGGELVQRDLFLTAPAVGQAKR